MGERKGQNFYYPPDFDPKVHGSLNGYHGVHALRERARKMDRGILIIRFEMPYNIWCGGCNQHIGMGVRYNAEKTKVGMYYTTPIYQFRMKCHLCTNHFSIKTDPANLDYVIVEGATRQERRWDPTQNGQVVPDDKSVGRKLADDAMYKLEHQNTDKSKIEEAAPRMYQISDIQDRVKDDYLANRMLRDKFRKKKKQLLEKQKHDECLQKKASINIDLVDECPEDVKFAQLLSLQARKQAEQLAQEGQESIKHQDIFSGDNNDRVRTTNKMNPKAISTPSSSRLIQNNGFGSEKSNIVKSFPNLGIVKKKVNKQNSNQVQLDETDIMTKNNTTEEDNIVSMTSTELKHDTIQTNTSVTKKTGQHQNDNPFLLLSNYSDSSSDDNE